MDLGSMTLRAILSQLKIVAAVTNEGVWGVDEFAVRALHGLSGHSFKSVLTVRLQDSKSRPGSIGALISAAQGPCKNECSKGDGLVIASVIARNIQMNARPTSRPLHPRVRAYLDAVVRTCADGETGLVSVILFGSAATGGFSGTVSDVDLILVLPTGATADDRRRLRDAVVRIEILHGMREPAAGSRGKLESLMDRITGNERSFFVCTRQDLLSGSVARILDLRPAQAIFVDRVVIPSIVASAVTVWGEELLPRIPLPPIRRLDVFKAFFGLFCQVLTSAAWFPVLPGATRYAMGGLKRSVHNCFFCYHGRPAVLDEEIDFFQQRLGPSRALAELLSLRRAYRESFGFVVRCLPAIARLHLRTALENRFPRSVRSEQDG